MQVRARTRCVAQALAHPLVTRGCGTHFALGGQCPASAPSARAAILSPARQRGAGVGSRAAHDAFRAEADGCLRYQAWQRDQSGTPHGTSGGVGCGDQRDHARGSRQRGGGMRRLLREPERVDDRQRPSDGSRAAHDERGAACTPRARAAAAARTCSFRRSSLVFSASLGLMKLNISEVDTRSSRASVLRGRCVRAVCTARAAAAGAAAPAGLILLSLSRCAGEDGGEGAASSSSAQGRYNVEPGDPP